MPWLVAVAKPVLVLDDDLFLGLIVITESFLVIFVEDGRDGRLIPDSKMAAGLYLPAHRLTRLLYMAYRLYHGGDIDSMYWDPGTGTPTPEEDPGFYLARSTR